MNNGKGAVSIKDYVAEPQAPPVGLLHCFGIGLISWQSVDHPLLTGPTTRAPKRSPVRSAPTAKPASKINGGAATSAATSTFVTNATTRPLHFTLRTASSRFPKGSSLKCRLAERSTSLDSATGAIQWGLTARDGSVWRPPARKKRRLIFAINGVSSFCLLT
jgi:hypothetical protein